MYAIDSSSLIAYFEDGSGEDVELIDRLSYHDAICLPSVVVTETLSNVHTRIHIESAVRKIPMLGEIEDFWFRASELRARILSHKLKANIADTLIAQTCIDHDIPLITRDMDFRHFAKHGGLKLAVAGD